MRSTNHAATTSPMITSMSRRSAPLTACILAALAASYPLTPVSAEPLRFVELVGPDVLGEDVRVLDVEVIADALYVTVLPPVATAETRLLAFSRDEADGGVELVSTYGEGGVAFAGGGEAVALGRGGGNTLVADGDVLYAEVVVEGECLEPSSFPCRFPRLARLSAETPDALALTSLTPFEGAVLALAPSADGTRLTAVTSGELRRYAVREDGTLGELSSLPLAVRAGGGAISRDGSRVVTSGRFDRVTDEALDTRLTSIVVEPGSDAFRVVDTLELTGPDSTIIPHIAISPDGRRLYGFRDITDERRVAFGLVPYAIGGDGSVMSLAADVPLDESGPDALPTPLGLTVSSDGRQVYAISRVAGEDGYLLAKHTVGASALPIFRGTVATGTDGVPDGALIGADRFAMSPDDAFLYVGGQANVTVFAIHADTDVRIVGASLDAGNEAVEHVVQVLNAGPATAHEVTLSVEASAPILAVTPADGCTIDGNVASCIVDSVAERALFERVVRVAAAAGRDVTLAASVSQIETDRRPEDNAAESTTTAEGVSDGLSEPLVEPTDESGSNDGGPVGSGGGGGAGMWLALVLLWRSGLVRAATRPGGTDDPAGESSG